MSGYTQREDRLFDPVTGLLVGYVDLFGREQLLNAAAMQSLVSGDVNFSGALLCDWSSNGTLSLVSANGGAEAVALDPTVLCDGVSMLKCTFKGSTTFIASFDFSALPRMAYMRTLQIPVRFSSNVGCTDISNPLQVWLYNAAGSKQYRAVLTLSTLRSGVITIHSQKAGWSTEGWAGSGGAASTTELDADTVLRIRVVMATPAGYDGQSVWLGPIRVNGRKSGVVSVVIDGEYAAQAQYILPMMNGYSLRGSMAVTVADIGTGGRMTQAQITAAYGEGHEVIQHTYDSTKTGGYAVSGQWADQAAIVADLRAGQAYLTAQGWMRGLGYYVHGFSYPYDQSISQARQEIVAAAYQAVGAKAVRKSVPYANRLQSAARPADVDVLVVQGAAQVSSSAPAVALTLGATSGATTATAASAQWTTDDVGKAIYLGVAGAAITAVAVITSYVSSTVVNINITTAFGSTAVGSGSWTLADTAATMMRKLDAAEVNGEWAIFTVHRAVVGSPAVTITGAVAPSLLEICAGELDAFFADLASRKRAGRVRVLPFGEGAVFCGLNT